MPTITDDTEDSSKVQTTKQYLAVGALDEISRIANRNEMCFLAKEGLVSAFLLNIHNRYLVEWIFVILSARIGGKCQISGPG